MLRIAHITAAFPPYRSGTGTVCYHNALEAARIGHDVHVFTADYGAQPALGDDPDGVTVHRLKPIFRVGNAPLLPGLLNVGRFDVIHLHYPFIFGAELASMRSLLSRTPYVITYHQDVILGGAMGRAVLAHEALVGRAILRGAQRLMFTTLDYGRASRVGDLMDRLGGRVIDMPNGVDPAVFHPHIDTSALRDRYRLTPADRVALFVGGLDRAHYFKGVPVLLEALARIADPRVKAVIVGDGDLRAQFQGQASALGVAERVIFAGRVAQAELPAHYAMCDLLVLPSITMGEAFGIVLLEAMACAKPVIASDLPGVRTVAAHGECGLVFPPGDSAALASALGRLFADGDLRRRMGANGRARVESTYAWARIGESLAQIYAQVSAEAGAAAGAKAGSRG
jgi:glycosyltransferase involved in cell wall biosynthesis